MWRGPTHGAKASFILFLSGALWSTCFSASRASAIEWTHRPYPRELDYANRCSKILSSPRDLSRQGYLQELAAALKTDPQGLKNFAIREYGSRAHHWGRRPPQADDEAAWEKHRVLKSAGLEELVVDPGLMGRYETFVTWLRRRVDVSPRYLDDKTPWQIREEFGEALGTRRLFLGVLASAEMLERLQKGESPGAVFAALPERLAEAGARKAEGVYKEFSASRGVFNSINDMPRDEESEFTFGLTVRASEDPRVTSWDLLKRYKAWRPDGRLIFDQFRDGRKPILLELTVPVIDSIPIAESNVWEPTAEIGVPEHGGTNMWIVRERETPREGELAAPGEVLARVRVDDRFHAYLLWRIEPKEITGFGEPSDFYNMSVGFERNAEPEPKPQPQTEPARTATKLKTAQ